MSHIPLLQHMPTYQNYAFSPLPDGSTLATFVDVTDSVNIAKALVDRNNALVEADRQEESMGIMMTEAAVSNLRGMHVRRRESGHVRGLESR